MQGFSMNLHPREARQLLILLGETPGKVSRETRERLCEKLLTYQVVSTVGGKNAAEYLRLRLSTQAPSDMGAAVQPDHAGGRYAEPE